MAKARRQRNNEKPPENHGGGALVARFDPKAGFRVTDDLPQPLPVLPGEGDIVRLLLGERLRQILQDDTL